MFVIVLHFQNVQSTDDNLVSSYCPIQMPLKSVSDYCKLGKYFKFEYYRYYSIMNKL